MSRKSDEAQVRALIATFVDGWNAGDGAALARAFHADADFTAITGLRAKGRDLIARGHDEILSTIYEGVRQSAAFNDVRFLRDDVAVADVTLTLSPARFGLSEARLGVVATCESGVWGVAVFRNMVPFGRPNAGPIEDSLKPASAA